MVQKSPVRALHADALILIKSPTSAVFKEDPESQTAPQEVLSLWAGGRTSYVRTLRKACEIGSYSETGYQPCLVRMIPAHLHLNLLSIIVPLPDLVSSNLISIRRGPKPYLEPKP